MVIKTKYMLSSFLVVSRYVLLLFATTYLFDEATDKVLHKELASFDSLLFKPHCTSN